MTLAEESAYYLGASTYADKLIAYYRQRIYYYIRHCNNAHKVMVHLGFSPNAVHRAMELKANNIKAALDWLIEHESSTGFDENLKINSPRSSLTRRGSILSSMFDPTEILC